MPADYRLILMVGLPYSGKTTAALQIASHADQPACIVNPDSIRLALHGERFLSQAEPMVWALAEYMVIAAFLAGHQTVIVDATNNTMKRRARWWRLAREMQLDIEVVAEVMEADDVTCEARAEQAGDELILRVIGRMNEAHEPVDEKVEGIGLLF